MFALCLIEGMHVHVLLPFDNTGFLLMSKLTFLGDPKICFEVKGKERKRVETKVKNKVKQKYNPGETYRGFGCFIQLLLFSVSLFFFSFDILKFVSHQLIWSLVYVVKKYV